MRPTDMYWDTADELETYERYRRSVRAQLSLDGAMIRSGLLGTALVVPIGFVFSNSASWIGHVYGAAYTAVMLFPSALIVVLIVDAVRVIIGRPAIFLPFILANAQNDGAPQTFRSAPVRWLMVEANLFINLWRICYIWAWHVRPDEMRRAHDQADEYAQQLRQSGRPRSRVVPPAPPIRRPKTHHTEETPVPV